MPCRSEYMEATAVEVASRELAEHVIYLDKCYNRPTGRWVKQCATDYYGNKEKLDMLTRIVCDYCKAMTDKEKDKYIYDGKNKSARKLADWWDKHQEVDKQRTKEEKEKAHKQLIKDQAMSKLTEEERRALDLNWCDD